MDIHRITDSSVIEGYTYEEGDLTIYFTDGSVRTYLDVPSKTVQEFREAKSVGLYFNLNIRDQFKVL